MLLTWFSWRFFENEADENIPIVNWFFLLHLYSSLIPFIFLTNSLFHFTIPLRPPWYPCMLTKSKKGGWKRYTPQKICLVFKALAKIWSWHSSQKYSNIFLTVCATYILVNNLSLGKLCDKMTSTFQCCHNTTTKNARCYLFSTCRTHTVSYHMRSTNTLDNNERKWERGRDRGGREGEREYRQRVMNKLTLASHAFKITL